MTRDEIECLKRATLANGLVQLATHFPAELEALGTNIEGALTHALGLAEEAIALAPHLPDGHTTLARLILQHDGDEAARDAEGVARHALALDDEHDPAHVALAAALEARRETAAAFAEVDGVIQRGSAHPLAYALRARLHLAEGRAEPARRDLERALVLAPNDGPLHVEAATLFGALDEPERAEEHEARAAELARRPIPHD